MVNTRERRRNIYDHYKTSPKCVQLSKMRFVNLRQAKCCWPPMCFVVQCCRGKGVSLDCFAPSIIAFWNQFCQSLYGIELVTFYGKYCYRSGICKRKCPKIYQKRQWSSQTVANIGNFLSFLDWRITASLRKKLYLTVHYPDDQRVLGILRKHCESKLLLHTTDGVQLSTRINAFQERLQK